MTKPSTNFFEVSSVQNDDDCMDCRFSAQHPSTRAACKIGVGLMCAK